MALIDQLELTDKSFIAIWRMEESAQELLKMIDLTPTQSDQYQTISSEKRRKEWLCSKIILKKFLGKQADIQYRENGSPYIPNREIELSITHNDNLCCVLLSNNRCGIDIESFERDFSKVSKRFLSQQELLFISTNLLQTISWCAKETLYKFIGKNGIDFKKEFTITELSTSEQRVTMRYKSELYKISYFDLQTNIISYIIS